MNREDGNKKYDCGAMRLMEALSGVDEVLLKRCGWDVRSSEESNDRINDSVVGDGVVSSSIDQSVSSTVGTDSGNRKAGSRSRKRKPLWQYTKAWAAVICLAVVGTLSWGGYKLTNMVNDKGAAGSAGNDAALPEAVDITAQDIGEQQAEGGAEEQIRMPSSMAEENSSSEDPPLNDLNAAKDKENAMQEADGMTSGSADFSGGENMPEVENKVMNQEEKSTDTMIDTESCLRLNAIKLTEEAARDVDSLGGYLPTKLPQGYRFESAYSNQDVQEENLNMTWTRGMDSIMISITLPADLPATVDVNQPETYDERLYEIPFAETVPEEYRASVDNPVFAWEDMSLEIVRSRMMAREDQGDTNTPRGNFTVLYSDGVVLRFSGRGTAEEIWEMLCSCGMK